MPCPVLTVGKYVGQDAREGAHLRSVLFPTDFSRISRVALAYTESLTKHLAGRLLLLYVDEMTWMRNSTQDTKKNSKHS